MGPTRILAIAASPRRGGNTDALLDEAILGAEKSGAEVERYLLSKKKIAPCIECYGCAKTGRCVVKDDIQEFYDRLFEIDAIIVSSPVFFMGAPAQLKALIDRTQCLWVRKYLLKKRILPRDKRSRRGYMLSTGGYNKAETFDCLRKVMKFFFLTIDMEFAGEVVLQGIDGVGDIQKHKDVLTEAHDLGGSAAE